MYYISSFSFDGGDPQVEADFGGTITLRTFKNSLSFNTIEDTLGFINIYTNNIDGSSSQRLLTDVLPEETGEYVIDNVNKEFHTPTRIIHYSDIGIDSVSFFTNIPI